MKNIWERLTGLTKASLSHFSGRFSKRTVALLHDSGWREGRHWDPIRLGAYATQFEVISTSSAYKVLDEFGGLKIGGGRFVIFDHFNDRAGPLELLEKLTSCELYPIGVYRYF